ncbi:hypothetical protein DMN91_005115 [Ooceraea biroi]|uniref:Uncharacterized protein n=1 Tax=Ooceraea biroi TaxID=2015173 RepID=A0A3L8DR06_OOCBI|nr:hypothetical protein DMN91_005115 [Ooceraea biroi]
MSRREHNQARATASQAVRPEYSPSKEATTRPPTSRPRYPRSRQDQLCAALETTPPPSRPRIRPSRPASTPVPAPTHRAPLTPAQFRAEMEALFGDVIDIQADLGVIEGSNPPAAASPNDTGPTNPPRPTENPPPPPNQAPPPPPTDQQNRPPRRPRFRTRSPTASVQDSDIGTGIPRPARHS